MKVKSESEVAQSCPTLSNPMDCSLPGPSIHGIFQARVLEWGAIYLNLYQNSPFHPSFLLPASHKDELVISFMDQSHFFILNLIPLFFFLLILLCINTLSSTVYGGGALVAKPCPTLCYPIDCSPPGSCPRDFPGKNTGVGFHFLLQGIGIPDPGFKSASPALQAGSLLLSHQGSHYCV